MGDTSQPAGNSVEQLFRKVRKGAYHVGECLLFIKAEDGQNPIGKAVN